MFADRPKFGTEQYQAGSAIIQEGDAPDKFYVIVSGEVDITQKDEQGDQIINHLGPRQFFGEIGILRTDKRTATVRAATDVEVMSLNRSAFLNWLAQSEAIHKKIKHAVDQRISADEQQQAKQTPAPSPPTIPATGPEQFPPGTIIVKQGDNPELFYIILDGDVEVFHTGPHNTIVPIAQLGRGDYFGEIGLLVDRPRITSVRAITSVKAISFNREEFATWMTVFPSGQHGIKQTAQQRLRETADLLRKKTD
ncbi:MAG: cyclic nucleotide-binding domain-containing protein [Ardenticatenaceae bacterium]|nr:cyclic nucleotide-binding domain-containing protein [Ardenticatenaceae bacterium]